MEMEDLFPFHSPAALSFLKKFLSVSDSHNHETATSDNNPGLSTSCLLKKAFIMCSIKEGMAHGTVPEEILDSLLLIEQLDRKQGLSVSDSMRAAFCAVALHCTISSLARSWPCYFHAVQRIWRFRIQNLEDSGTTHLIGPDLAKWREDVEAALWDSQASQRLLRINTRSAALQSLRVYLGEACSSMKPVLLGLALPTTNDASAAAHATSPRPPRCTVKGKGTMRVNSKARCSRRHYKGPVVIANSEEEGPSGSKDGSLSTAEVNKVRDALKSSTAELLAAVTDPLPEALEVAERVASQMARNKVNKPSLMERNGTARTYEWEDSVSISSEGTHGRSKRCGLPSPKIKPVSPLKEGEQKKWKRRRKINRWTLDEEKALMKGVEK